MGKPRIDLVICSTAKRAQQTLGPITKVKKPPKVVLEREIYGGLGERTGPARTGLLLVLY
jgi:phosphohistidine phosphatase SixA